MFSENEILRYVHSRECSSDVCGSAGMFSLEAFNMSRLNHVMIAKSLRFLSFRDDIAGKELYIVFMDGSKPTGFPVGTLSESKALSRTLMTSDSLPELRVGLMSFRHPEMDFFVDFYAVRNLELATQVSMANEEETAFSSCVNLFDDTELKNGGRIFVYHTGLEPMVVGFYRGVVEVLKRRRERRLSRNLIFVPHFLNTKPTKNNLTPESPGAKQSSYVTGDSWY